MVTNDAKEQLYSPLLVPCGSGNAPSLRTEASYPSTPKISVFPREGSTSPAMPVKARICEMKRKAKRVSTLRSGRAARSIVTRVGLHTSSMYGCEVDPRTLGDIRQLRMGVAAGLHLGWGPSNRIASMLLTPPGLTEPKALYVDKVLLNWHRQMACGMGPNQDICRYWSKAVEDGGRAKGPIHLVTQTLGHCGIVAPRPTRWIFPHMGLVDIARHPNLRPLVRDVCGRLEGTGAYPAGLRWAGVRSSLPSHYGVPQPHP